MAYKGVVKRRERLTVFNVILNIGVSIASIVAFVMLNYLPLQWVI